MKKIKFYIFIIFIVVLLIKIPKINSQKYVPPPIPKLKGILAPNQKLLKAKKIIIKKGFGAEDVEIDKHGNIYTGLEDGTIIRINKKLIIDESKNSEIYIDGDVIANTGGRPFGLRFGPDENLYVADGYKGLLKIDFQNNFKIQILTTEADGIPFRFTDHLDIASDGKIYFTDASSKYGPGEYLYDLLESRPYGRFLVYDPQTKQTKTLIKDMYFANGVAISEDESFVLVNETYRYKIWRYWLKGDKKDSFEVFYENLPGFPDNIRKSKDIFWVCLFTKRNALMDSIHPYPFIKNLLSGLPKFLWPKPAKYGFILKLDSEGRILETYQNPDTIEPKFTIITGVQQYQDELFFSSLYGNWIGWLKLKN